MLLAALLLACQAPYGADLGPSLAVTGDDDDDTGFLDTGDGASLEDDETLEDASSGSPPEALDVVEEEVAVADPQLPDEVPVAEPEVAEPAVDVPSEPEPRPPTTYRLDPADSFLAVVVTPDGSTIGSGLGHDHVLVASSFRGEVVWTPDDPSACAIGMSFPVTALTVDPAGARGRAGLDPSDTVAPKKLGQIRDNALSARQLDAERFGRVHYRADTCVARDDGRYDVTGTLTIHGVARTLTVPMAISDRGGFHATGSFTARATDFGFEPFRALAGALRNDDRMRFVVDVRGT